MAAVALSTPLALPGLAVAGLVVAGLVAACSPAPTARAGAGAELTVLAAASLRDPLVAVARAYEAVADVRLVVATDSSTTLRVQVEQGAQADVFLAADTANPASLAASGLVDGTVVVFAGNRLAIVVPSGNPAGIASPADLGRPGVEIVAAGDGVPITAYATTLLGRLAALPGYPPDFLEAYAANVVTREDNVRAVMAKIELGEGDAAIVYATDAVGSGAVEAIAIPATATVTATYAGCVLAGAADRPAAHAFLGWLAGPGGRDVLGAFGFVSAP